MDVQAFFDSQTATVSYLVSDPDSQAAAIIDPVLDYEPKAARIKTASADAILAAAANQGLRVEWVLETHAHADHLSAADYIRNKTGARIAIGARIAEVQKVFSSLFNLKDVAADGSAFDKLLADGETFKIGALEGRTLATPGHTPACVTYVIGDAAFVGDTLFMPDYGTARTDFPGGDAATLYRSIRKILSLPDATRIFTGHDYLPEGRTMFAWESSVAEQKAHNVHMHEGVGESEFVALRNARDATLAPPVLILPSLQVNIRAGALPPPEDDGQRYLKLPLNRLGA